MVRMTQKYWMHFKTSVTLTNHLPGFQMRQMPENRTWIWETQQPAIMTIGHVQCHRGGNIVHFWLCSEDRTVKDQMYTMYNGFYNEERQHSRLLLVWKSNSVLILPSSAVIKICEKMLNSNQGGLPQSTGILSVIATTVLEICVKRGVFSTLDGHHLIWMQSITTSLLWTDAVVKVMWRQYASFVQGMQECTRR